MPKNKSMIYPMAKIGNTRYGYDKTLGKIVEITAKSAVMTAAGGKWFEPGVRYVKGRNFVRVVNIIDTFEETSVYTVVDRDKNGTTFHIVNIQNDNRVIGLEDFRKMALNSSLNLCIDKDAGLDYSDRLDKKEHDIEENTECADRNSQEALNNKLKELIYSDSSFAEEVQSKDNFSESTEKFGVCTRDFSNDTLSEFYFKILGVMEVGDIISIPKEAIHAIDGSILSILDSGIDSDWRIELREIAGIGETHTNIIVACKVGSDVDKIACQVMRKSKYNYPDDINNIKYDYAKWRQSRKFIR